MYEYPKTVVDFITEKESEGCEIITTSTVDGVMWIVIENVLDKWITIIEWYEGNNDYSLINVCGKAFDRLYKTMAEVNQ